jgi:hypothetical protein
MKLAIAGVVGLSLAAAFSATAPFTQPSTGSTSMSTTASSQATQSRPARAALKRTADLVYLEPIDPMPIYQQNTVMACLSAGLRAMGEDCTYAYAMGVSGAAFRFQLSQGGWCGSSPHACCGFDCYKIATDALGYEIASYLTKPDDEEGQTKAFAAIKASIDAGVPVIGGSEEAFLVVGYKHGGRMQLRCSPLKQEGKPHESDKVPWGFDILKAQAHRPDRAAVVQAALKRGVEIATASELAKYDAGIPAMKRWIGELRLSEEEFGKLDPKNYQQTMNAWIYCGLCDARAAAFSFLREVAPTLPEGQRAAVLKAAELYEKVHNTLAGEMCPLEITPYPDKSGPNWTAKHRARQADLLEKAIPLEQAAIEALKAAMQ